MLKKLLYLYKLLNAKLYPYNIPSFYDMILKLKYKISSCSYFLLSLEGRRYLKRFNSRYWRTPDMAMSERLTALEIDDSDFLNDVNDNGYNKIIYDNVSSTIYFRALKSFFAENLKNNIVTYSMLIDFVVNCKPYYDCFIARDKKYKCFIDNVGILYDNITSYFNRDTNITFKDILDNRVSLRRSIYDNIFKKIHNSIIKNYLNDRRDYRQVNYYINFFHNDFDAEIFRNDDYYIKYYLNDFNGIQFNHIIHRILNYREDCSCILNFYMKSCGSCLAKIIGNYNRDNKCKSCKENSFDYILEYHLDGDWYYHTNSRSENYFDNRVAINMQQDLSKNIYEYDCNDRNKYDVDIDNYPVEYFINKLLIFDNLLSFKNIFKNIAFIEFINNDNEREVFMPLINHRNSITKHYSNNKSSIIFFNVPINKPFFKIDDDNILSYNGNLDDLIIELKYYLSNKKIASNAHWFAYNPSKFLSIDSNDNITYTL